MTAASRRPGADGPTDVPTGSCVEPVGPSVGSGGQCALTARVRVGRGSFLLDVAVHAEPGRVVAVLGANGSGKSTLLALLAGRLLPDEGEVRVGDRILTQVRPPRPGGGPRGDVVTAVRPEHRSVGLLSQDPLVFPHLSVRENVAFGLRAARMPAPQARRAADEWLEAVGLGGLGRRRPATLSGGQRQRVGLARALAPAPAALLLDEPLSALDVRTAAELRTVVRDQVRRTQTATVLVTHDVVDVLTLADQVLVLHEGRVVEQGAPLDVLTAPVDPFTAALAGVNLVVGTVAHRAGGGTEVVARDGVRVPCRTDLSDGTPVQATFAPAAVEVRPPTADGWAARVDGVEAGPSGLRLRTTGDVVVDVAPTDVPRFGVEVGSPVRLHVPADHVRVRVRG